MYLQPKDIKISSVRKEFLGRNEKNGRYVFSFSPLSLKEKQVKREQKQKVSCYLYSC